MKRVLGVLGVVGVLGGGGALASCQRQPEYSGLGPYMLGETTLAYGRQHARCQEDGAITWCFGAPPIRLGEQPATVDLYFVGHDDSALLVEIALRVRGCKDKEAEAALVGALGPPTESRNKLRFWKSRASFVAAKLRVSGVACEVSFVDPNDKARIERLERGE